MTKRLHFPILAAVLAVTSNAPLVAQGGTAVAKLRGFEEVPALSMQGGGKFKATINDDGTHVDYELTYTRMTGSVTQAHLHFAQTGVNGGIAVFLCSNLGNGPAGTPNCPDDDGHLTGSIDASDVVGPAGQGIAPGEFGSFLRALRGGIVYANVHTNLFHGGEIRGQLTFKPN